MNIIEIKEKVQLNNFVGSIEKSQFLQSWEWGEFQKNLGRKVWRLGLQENNNLLSSVLVVKHSLSFGKNYLYCPRGPVVRTEEPKNLRTKDLFNELMKKIVEIAKQEKSMFVRIEPPLEKSSEQIFRSITSGFNISQTKFVQPKNTLILDLAKSEEELLSEMHQKTRYNIRLAKRKGVKIRIGRKEDFENFWQLNLETAKRDNFKTHPKDYYKKMLEVLEPEFLKLFMAEYQGKILVANLVIFFGDTITYVHGASSSEFRNVMAPHLAQWRQILEGKKHEFKYYDMWGIMPGPRSTDYGLQSWAGLTRFKRGFSGQEVNYTGTYDLILDSFWYNIYKLGRRFLKS